MVQKTLKEVYWINYKNFKMKIIKKTLIVKKIQHQKIKQVTQDTKDKNLQGALNKL